MSECTYLRPLPWVLDRLGVSATELDALLLTGELTGPIATRNSDGAQMFDGLQVHELSKKLKREKAKQEHDTLAAELIK